MRTDHRIPLDELQTVNPQLYGQIFNTAESNLAKRLPNPVHQFRDRDDVRQQQRPPETSDRIIPPAESVQADVTIVKAVVGEVAVTVNVRRAVQLATHLESVAANNTLDDGLRKGCDRAARRLQSLLTDIYTPPPLPPILSGTSQRI